MVWGDRRWREKKAWGDRLELGFYVTDYREVTDTERESIHIGNRFFSFHFFFFLICGVFN